MTTPPSKTVVMMSWFVKSQSDFRVKFVQVYKVSVITAAKCLELRIIQDGNSLHFGDLSGGLISAPTLFQSVRESRHCNYEL